MMVGGPPQSLFKTFAAGNHDQSTHRLHDKKQEKKRMRGLVTLVSTGDLGSGAAG
jgi:hypothetical protein